MLANANLPSASSISPQRVEALHLHLEVGQFLNQIVACGQELVQRRVDEADDYRLAVHGAEQAGKIVAL